MGMDDGGVDIEGGLSATERLDWLLVLEFREKELT